jgi:hypothetical protein
MLCTDLEATPLQILSWFVLRWQLEVTFHAARAHLSVETQRQWAERAIARTTSVLLGLFSLVTLLAHEPMMAASRVLPHAAWYTKATNVHRCAGARSEAFMDPDEFSHIAQ